MSDEMNWGQTPQEDSDNRENSQTEQKKTYQPEKPAAHPYSAARYSQTEHDSTQETPPRYEHYQFGQEQKNYQGTGMEPDKKPENHGGFSKKLGTTVALAVVFGLVSAGIFQGVNLAVDKYTGKNNNSQQVATTKTVTASDDADTEETAAAGKGTVAEVAQASMPSVVAITSVSVQEIPNIFGGYFGYGGTQQYQSAGSGSGIIVGENDSELLIATNNHVVEGATTLSVCFIGSDVVNAEEETQNLVNEDGDINVEDAVTAKIKGTDPDNDLAVVAVQKSDIPEDTMSEIKIAQLGNSDSLDVGE